MKRLVVLMLLAFPVGAMALPLATPASAHEDDCDVLDASVSYDAQNDECDLNGPITKNGSFDIGHSLHIGPQGKITTDEDGGITLDIAGDLIIDVPSGGTGSNGISGDVTTANDTGRTIVVNAEGDVVLHGDGTNGAKVSSDQIAGSCSGGKGGEIELHAEGDVLVAEGAQVTVNARCPAGDITITSTNIDIDGLVESRSDQTGTGNASNTPKGGGTITIDASCSLNVRGKVSSEGRDPGADLVHLEGGCEVRILGLVQSIGVGHGLPTTDGQHSNACGGGLGDRPDKEFEEPHEGNTQHVGNTSCVEVWAGNLLLIDAPAGGQVKVGNTQAPNKSWTDLFARGPVVIIGCAEECDYFAVNDNGDTSTNTFGGIVTVKSKESNVTASHNAIQANGSSGGGRGGTVTVEAALDVTLDTANIEAKGGTSGGGPLPGSILVRSFQEDLSWLAGSGNVSSTSPGTIDLKACGSITTTGTSFTGATPATDDDACPPPSEPSFESYVDFPECECEDGTCTRLLTIEKRMSPPLGPGESYTFTFDIDGPDPFTAQAQIEMSEGEAADVAVVEADGPGDYTVDEQETGPYPAQQKTTNLAEDECAERVEFVNSRETDPTPGPTPTPSTEVLAQSTSRPELPATGFGLLLMGTAGWWLVAAGAAMLYLRRRWPR